MLPIEIPSDWARTPLNDMKTWLANAQHVKANRSSYSYDTVMLAIEACITIPPMIAKQEERNSRISVNHAGGRSKSDSITLADAKAMGIRTYKTKQVKPKLVQAGAQGTGKRK